MATSCQVSSNYLIAPSVKTGKANLSWYLTSSGFAFVDGNLHVLRVLIPLINVECLRGVH